jgi:hypothetical protein
LELVKYLDQCGLGSRVIFRRAKPVPSHGRVEIRPRERRIKPT